MKYIYIFILLFSSNAFGQLIVDAETGIAFNSSNDIRYPNDPNSEANLVNVPKEFGVSQSGFARLRVSYIIKDKHTISGLYAPLTFNAFGHFDRPIQFGEQTFLPTDETRVKYKFNSYRLTYRYRFVDRKLIRFGMGLTGKIRDARIAFGATDKYDQTTDLGFVPLINFRLDLYPTERLSFTLNGDALVGAQGRAEDIFAGFEYKMKSPVRLKLGYRILEGGADIDQVYNFALVHYASVGCLFNFKKK